MEEHKESTEHQTIPEQNSSEPEHQAIHEQNTQDSPTGGEIPQKVEQQPAQMFKAKKRDEEKIAAEKKSSWKKNVWAFLKECKRVLRITKKPDKEELKMIVKVSGLGIIIIGMIGFIIHFIKELLF